MGKPLLGAGPVEVPDFFRAADPGLCTRDRAFPAPERRAKRALSQRLGQRLWAQHIWFNENDVLHIGLMLWMVYIALVLARFVVDHDPMVTEPQRFNQLVSDFLKD